ncbi:phage baseplate assembly protein V [Defluviitalea saccharophila]|uniref:Phage baseplate assembly protein V n=1 Tax=Defluviitalea saccharophila TaxID=879970 RepID=A0ABZ2Y706_9FIRM
MSIYDILTNDNHNQRKVAYGVTVGIVTNNKDPEKLGRVKVKLINRDSDTYETDWIRISTLMSGKEMGTFFLPEVNDEVLVAFNGGDPHKPYVIGSLWNAKEKPPETNEDGKNNLRKIKTRSGSELIFDDTEGKEKIEIHTPKKHKLNFDDENEKITVSDKDSKNKIEINIKNGEITILADKKITVKTGNTSIAMDGSANSINIESGTSLNIKSQKIDINASAAMNINGATLNLKSDAALSLKGAVVKIN